jgi:hypothetical protein
MRQIHQRSIREAKLSEIIIVVILYGFPNERMLDPHAYLLDVMFWGNTARVIDGNGGARTKVRPREVGAVGPRDIV